MLRKIGFTGFALLLIAGAVWLWRSPLTFSLFAVPADPATELALQETIQDGYACIGTAARNGGDVSCFNLYFADDPAFLHPIFIDGRDFIAQVLGPEAAQHSGYSTAMQATYAALGKSVQLLRDAQEQARRENRQLTYEELARIKQQSYGITPPSLVGGGSGGVRKFDFQEMIVRGDRATVVYDDMQALQKATLKFIDGSWYIIDITPLDVHF